MSVPQNQRQQGKFEVLTQALDLCVYTRQILKNPKNFPPETDEDILEKIRDNAEDIYRYAWLANDMKVGGRTSAMARDKLQAKAISSCADLIIHINIAYKMFHIATKRIVHWMGLVESARKLLKAWRSADRKRYQEQYGRYDSS